MATKDSRAKWHADLDRIEKEALAQFPDWRAKNEQLHGHLATVHMVVDDLHDLTPYHDATT